MSNIDTRERELLSQISDLRRRLERLETKEKGRLIILALTDGTTAPTTITGVAQIYVDTADGDLKVKFGDGTTKTLATDT